MKRVTFIILSLIFSLNIMAQENAPKEKKLDIAKLEAEYIANEDILSDSELESYTNISQEFDSKHRTIRREIRTLEKSLKDITTDEEAEKVMFLIADKKIELETLDKEYLSTLLKEIPAQKLIKVKSACKRFKGELFRNMHKAREKGKNKFSQPMKD